MDLTSQYTHFFPGRVELGNKTVSKLGGILKESGVKNPLLVTDPGVIKAGLADTVKGVLKESGMDCPVYSDVQPNPTEENVMSALDAYKKNGSNSLIGLGGGSAIDVAKAVRVMCSHPGKIEEYYAQTGGTERITKRMPYMVAIPTTSGTGAEAYAQ